MLLELRQAIFSSSMTNRLRTLGERLRPYHVAFLIAVAYLVIVLRANDGDPFALIRIGTRFDPGVENGSMGYDGQFSYQIALDPLHAASKLDVPAYRLQRILYPVLARAAALGSPGLIPWTLPIINLVALVIGVAATEAILRPNDLSPWWAIVYGLNIGMLMALRLDLTEPLAFMFVQLGVLAWIRCRPQTCALAFALAALSKEVTLLIAVGYVLGEAKRAGLRAALRWSLIVLTPFLLWQAVLLLWVGRPGLGSGGALSTPFEVLPFRAWWGIAEQDVATFLRISIVVVPLAVVPAVAGLLVSIRALARGFIHPTSASLALQSAAFLFLPRSNLLDPLGLSRFAIGLISSFLAMGAVAKDRRVLAYSQLWVLTLAFLPGDNFLPSG